MDLLPAGLEPENPKLQGQGRTEVREPHEADGEYELRPQYLSVRDDRVIAFASVRAGGTGKFRYACRAVTRGDFQLPPVLAEALYDPRIRSVSGAGRCVVK